MTVPAAVIVVRGMRAVWRVHVGEPVRHLVVLLGRVSVRVRIGGMGDAVRRRHFHVGWMCVRAA